MENDLLDHFLQTFQKAISVEMEAMRTALGPFEIGLTNGELIEQERVDSQPIFVYRFAVAFPNDKLVPQVECTLRCKESEHLVTLLQVEAGSVRLRSSEEIPIDGLVFTLMIYPWFLYEKLKLALETLDDDQRFSVDSALALFGKHPTRQQERPLTLAHDKLNSSQLGAVQLCCDSSLSFVWGPPGTGKTTTLAHIVAELLEQGQRVLVTSTTNAAIDQALDQLAHLPQACPRFTANEVVRLGQTPNGTFGVSLGEVIARCDRTLLDTLEHLTQRRRDRAGLAPQCRALLEKTITSTAQIDLFASSAPSLARTDLQRVFSPLLSRYLTALPQSSLFIYLGRRLQRLERLISLYDERIDQVRRELLQRESLAVSRARLVLATMTNVYLNKLLQTARFDVVIVEEAGMAILPTLFYCAALATDKVVAVGDPQQLPPIIQSRDAFVRRAMGRSIFAVTVPRPLESNLVALLNTQYRMHPQIGELVSELFYEGQLRHGQNTDQREKLAAYPPYPGKALVVIDTAGQTTCATAQGSFSRFNEHSAELCTQLAHMAQAEGLTSIGIITPYAEQARLIRGRLSSTGDQEAIECSTVHRFQGHERDLIILDTTDASPLPSGVLLDDHLLNVSISRARGKLLILADYTYYQRHAPRGIVCKPVDRARPQACWVTASF
jgi:hypothetical protein